MRWICRHGLMGMLAWMPALLWGALPWKDHSVLSAGTWVKVGVLRTGVYKLTYGELAGKGLISGAVSSDQLALWGQRGGALPQRNSSYASDDLREVPIAVVDGGDGRFDNGDYLLFFAEGPHRLVWDDSTRHLLMDRNYFTDSAFYFLRIDQPTPGKRIETLSIPSAQASITIAHAPGLFHHEVDQYNDVVSYTKTGQDWMGETFDLETVKDFPVALPASLLTDSPLYVWGEVGARSPNPSQFKVYFNGATLTTIDVSAASTNQYEADYMRPAFFEVSAPAVAAFTLRFQYIKSHPNGRGWLNYFSIGYRHRISTDAQQMVAYCPEGRHHATLAYQLQNTGSGTKVWHVARFDSIQSLPVQNGSQVVGGAAGEMTRLVLFEDWQAYPVASLQSIPNQDLHALGPADMVIITHPSLQQVAKAVKAYHKARDPFAIHIVNVEHIFNEFSAGRLDPMALRMFLKMLYDRYPDRPPRYVLLVGDASFDYKNRLSNNTQLVPTYQTRICYSPIRSYATDDFFIYLDDDEGHFESGAPGKPDVGIGRFPITDVAQGQAIVAKMQDYLSVQSMGDWRSRLLLMADDEDYNLHLSQTEALAGFIETTQPAYLIRKIYLDAFKQYSTPAGPRYPDAKAAMNREIDRGILLMNYYGHGGEKGLAHERILRINDIRSWRNRNRYPLIITATCEFGRYDNPEFISGGEEALLHPSGGAIALLTTTRLVYSDGNQRTVEALFRSGLLDGKRLGDAYLTTKQNTSGLNSYKFVLLGDPALRFASPIHRVQLTAVNGRPADTSRYDTLQALAPMTLEGEVVDSQGNLLSGFQGKVYVTVLEKPTPARTLGNDPTSYRTTFSVFDNYIFKGTAYVTNGRFSIHFVVPRDISYDFSRGRILLYAYDSLTLEDAKGHYDHIVVGGTSPHPIIDTTPPQIRLFINDENFIDSGLSHEDPLLIVYLKDDHGINTVSSTVGHELVAVLDEAQSVVLTDYYESLPDEEGGGVVRYQYYDLSPGWHSIRVEAWDVANNASEAEIHFYVTDGAALEADRVTAFPNPFSDRVSFIFEHNRPQLPLNVIMNIHNSHGRLVRHIERTLVSEGSRIPPGMLTWDGRNQSGVPAPEGVYIYSLILRDANGKVISFHGKVVKSYSSQ